MSSTTLAEDDPDAWLRATISRLDDWGELDECLVRLNREFDGHGTLPWWRS